MQINSVSLQSQTNSQSQVPQVKQARIVLILWTVMIILALLIRAGSLFAPVFLLGAPAVGLYLYFRTPILYVGYTWWMVFLVPLIRRIIDYQAGYVTFGRWSLPATLVTCISLITLLMYLPTSYRRGGLPFILSVLALFYSFSIGIANDLLSARYVLKFLEWIGPFAFGFHLFIHWRRYPDIRQLMEKIFAWGGLAMGAYAVYQFCVVPGWDTMYMNSIGADSFGSPTPFEIRVFGTQGAPQAFACVMMACLIMLLSSRHPIRFAASGVGYLGFLLTQSRAGWLGWCVAMIMLVPSLNLKLQMRLVITIIVMSLLVVPLASMEPFAETISNRLEAFNFQNLENDTSYNARIEGYNELIGLALKEFIGRGIGVTVGSSTLGAADTSIFPVIFSFGLIGSAVFMGGIILAILRLFNNKEGRSDAFSMSIRAVVLGMFSQIGFNQIFASELAILFWGSLGIAFAAQKYNYHQAHLLSPPQVKPSP